MKREIVKDMFFLQQKSTPATKADWQVVQDLQDTLKANAEICVGLAANMIGSSKRVIICSVGMLDLVMINPVITSKKKPYTTEEGCLSLTGVRKTTRYQEITVQYLDQNFQPRTGTFTEFPAQIIQHECDHLDGILI